MGSWAVTLHRGYSVSASFRADGTFSLGNVAGTYTCSENALTLWDQSRGLTWRYNLTWTQDYSSFRATNPASKTTAYFQRISSGRTEEPPSEEVKLKGKLETVISSFEGCDPGTKVVHALAYLDRYGLGILIDADAFRKANVSSVGEMKISLPRHERITVGMILQKLLSQVSAEYVIRDGRPIVVPRSG